MTDPDIFERTRTPVNLINKYSSKIKHVINGKPNTFGHKERALYGIGYAIYASNQMRIWDRKVHVAIKRRYRNYDVSAVKIVAGKSVFKKIFGKNKKVPAELMSNFGGETFAIPVIMDHGRVKVDVFGGDKFHAIRGVSFDEQKHLLILYQGFNIGILYPRKEIYIGWDVAAKNFVHHGKKYLHLLSHEWRWKLVKYLIDYHWFPCYLQ